MDLSLQKLQTLSVGQLSKLSGSVLLDIQQKAENDYLEAKDYKDWIEAAIALKYSEKAKSIRQQLCKDTGIIHFHDEGVSITEDLPKRVSWDQSKLSTIAQSLKDKGADVHEFIDISYKVSERKYTTWPKNLRTLFQEARTLKTGKPIFYLFKE